MMEWKNMFPDRFHPQAIMPTKKAAGFYFLHGVLPLGVSSCTCTLVL